MMKKPFFFDRCNTSKNITIFRFLRSSEKNASLENPTDSSLYSFFQIFTAANFVVVSNNLIL